jgi:NAD(P)H-hydrate epimerase
VLDADGLNAFAGSAEKLSVRDVDAARILTPHPGEFARLTGLDVSTIQANREAIAAEFATKHNVVLLLKGPRTVITDGKRKAFNSTGNSSLAKGGSGDVLTGLIASLIAQGMTAFEAAQLGAHLHGLAADCAVGSLAKQYITSNELLEHLNSAWIRYNT